MNRLHLKREVVTAHFSTTQTELISSIDLKYSLYGHFSSLFSTISFYFRGLPLTVAESFLDIMKKEQHKTCLLFPTTA